MNQSAVAFVGQDFKSQKSIPNFKAGDTVTVQYKIVEETKERIQKYKGIVIKRQGQGHTATFSVRKISNGIGVERTFPLHSYFVDKIEVNKYAKVRRARLFYLKNKLEKAMNLKEKIHFKKKADKKAKSEKKAEKATTPSN